MSRIPIGARHVGPDEPVLVIMELGINHNGDPGLAREMVDAAFANGADAVKFQTYRTADRFAEGNPFIPVFREYELSRDDERELWDWTRARHPDRVVMSTPFDADSAVFLAELGTDAMKIASFEAVNLELVRAAAQARVPVLFSTGTLTEREVERCAAVITEHGSTPIPLHCISSYPTREEDANLAVIDRLRQEWAVVGFSDHTEGVGASPYAVAAGACVVEKHFTLDRSMDGPDHAMSITPHDLSDLVDEVRRAERMRGNDSLGPRSCEAFVVENCRRVTS